MGCNNPLDAWQRTEGAPVEFTKPRGKIYRELKIDCTRCLGCRKRYKTEWAARVMLENELHEHSLFVTLTYDGMNVPDNWGLPYEDVQLYHKRMRKRFGKSPRFVNVGEYGGQKGRPHWHEIMWGINPGDLKVVGKGSRGDPLYGSEILESLWKKGGVRVGEVNATTAAYVTGYHLKDLDTKREGAFDFKDPDSGEWFTREMPKMRTSRNPGIAANFFEAHTSDIFPKGFTTLKGKRLYAPRYYLGKLEKVNPGMHAELVAKRQEFIESPGFQAEHTKERLAVKEKLLQIDQEKRKLDKGPSFGPEDSEFWQPVRMPVAQAIAAKMQQRHVDPNLVRLVRGVKF